ncbi:helix-turn-helix transcriptional regulator [Enterococcus sp. BWM-S5]|uniref:Helix-turn-helix transcriptional regulator n=1 Tax=Enterococcus larvae TaxID=2794352 RepID=A0ABS4CKG6_9ENTE|nr:helix-turn-helix transcriptional regulator [Enterococcus larvae]
MIQLSLRAVRVNRSLTLNEVVSILNDGYNVSVTRQKLSEYELDSTDVPINLAKALCSIYQVSENYIFFGSLSTLSYTYRKDQRTAI